MHFIDNLLDRITMYRLALYYLTALLVLAMLFGAFGIVPYSPWAILFSTVILVGVSWVANELFARAFAVQPNVESVYITAFILALIISPILPSQTSGIAFLVWAACVALTLLLAGAQYRLKTFQPILTACGWITGFLSICGAVIVRDGIRDLTLHSQGFDVWNRTVVANWGVLSIFFVLFAASLAVIGWLLLVMRQARPIAEQVTL